MKMIYIEYDYAIQQHEYILKISGGLPGIKEGGLLDSILGLMQNDDYYPTFEEKLSHLVFCINGYHIFADANKRTSIALGAYFLNLNGYHYCSTKFIRELENIIVWVAENKISKELLLRIVTSIIYEDEYSEELKLEIINSIG